MGPWRTPWIKSLSLGVSYWFLVGIRITEKYMHGFRLSYTPCCDQVQIPYEGGGSSHNMTVVNAGCIIYKSIMLKFLDYLNKAIRAFVYWSNLLENMLRLPRYISKPIKVAPNLTSLQWLLRLVVWNKLCHHYLDNFVLKSRSLQLYLPAMTNICPRLLTSFRGLSESLTQLRIWRAN